MGKYLPTPKMATALVLGLFGFGAVFAAEAAGLAEIQDAATGLVVLVFAFLGGYLKHDTSSPEPKIPDDH